MKANKFQNFSTEKLHARRKRYTWAAWIFGVVTFLFVCFFSTLILKGEWDAPAPFAFAPLAVLIGSVSKLIKRKKQVEVELANRPES